jgi:hypothetical protein
MFLEVLVHVVDGNLDELELWRGDGAPVQRRPRGPDITQVRLAPELLLSPVALRPLQRLEFRFRVTSADRSQLLDRWDSLLRIEGDFAILVEGRGLYTEVLFPLVEFAVEALKWIGSPGEPDGFLYESVEAEEPLIWIKRTDDEDGWQVGKIHESYSEPAVFTTDDIRSAISTYVEDLRTILNRDFGIDIDPVLWPPAGGVQ